MSAIEQSIDHPLLDAVNAGLNLKAVSPPRARRWRTGEITRPKLDSLRRMVPEQRRADSRPAHRRASPGDSMVLYRTSDGHVVAIAQDVLHAVDTGLFAAAIIGGRPMARHAAMGLLRQFGGLAITADGPQHIRPPSRR